MTNDPKFRVITQDTVIDKRLTIAELKQALGEVERIAALEWPQVDWTVSPIHLTHGEWHRQKVVGEQFRTILRIDRETREIIVIAVLVRDDDTYERVVRRLYLSS